SLVLCGLSTLLVSVWNVMPPSSCVKARPRGAHQQDGLRVLAANEGCMVCQASRGRRPCAYRETGDVHACRTRCWRGLAGSAGAACPHTPRGSLRSVVVRTVFYCRAVCCRAPGAGPWSSPLTASRGGGDHGGGWPLAAARGCRLLRRFFFLLKTRNVILV